MFSILNIIPEEKLKSFCRKYYIKKLSLFGSALQNKLTKDSDIDLLVEFDKKHIPGLMKISEMEIELTKLLGRRVDLHTPAELSRYFRNNVLATARIEYAA